MSLGLPRVSKPGIQEIPDTFHSNTANFGTLLKEKSASFLKVGKYALQWFKDFATTLTPDNLAAISLVQNGLSKGGAIETLLSGEKTLENAQAAVLDIAKKTKEWKSSALSTQGFASELLSAACNTIKKADDFLWASDTFGLPQIALTKTLHGVGYLATLVISVKELLKVEEKTSKIKKTKIAFTTLAALAGFFTLLFSSVKLTITYLALSTLTLGSNLTDYFLTNKSDPYRAQRESFEKLHQPPQGFIMRV